MSKILDVTIRGALRDYLRVRVTGRQRPGTEDADDDNWLRATAEIRVGRFSGSTACSLRTEDLADFRKGLAHLTDDRAATAHFRIMEEQLAITLKRDGRGGVTVTGHVGEGSGTGTGAGPDAGGSSGNRLSFRMAGDAGGLSDVVRALDQILDEYPVR